MSGRRCQRLATVVGLLGLISACDDGITPPEPPGGGHSAVPIVLDWQHPFPQGNDLRHLWGFSDGTFYAVGDGGVVLYYDGSTWTYVDTPAREDLQRLWVNSPDEVYAAGFGGTLIHYDGIEWKAIPTPTTTDLYAVCANSPDDIFITGVGGSVWNYDGSEWTEYVVAPGERLRALWSYSHDEVYVGGSDATFRRFNGNTWTDHPFPFTTRDQEYRDLWGMDPGSIGVQIGNYAGWTDGTTWWSAGTSLTQAYGFWGVSYDSVVVISAGLSGHYHAGERLYFDTPTGEPLYDVWGTAADDYVAVGRSGQIARFDGAGWSLLSEGSTSDLRDVRVTDVGGLAVGADGLILRRDGTDWTEEAVSPDYDLAGVWMNGDLAVAVGRDVPRGMDRSQLILMNTGTGWAPVAPVGEAHRLFDVWGSSADDVYAVGWAGEVLHYDGSSWSVSLASDGETAFLLSVDGTAPDHVVAVGRTNDLRGLVRRFDGSSWESTILPDVEGLYGVWVENTRSIFAVGRFGAIVRCDGSSWTAMESPTREALFAVWGQSSSDVWAAGWEGTLLHYDGSDWTRYLPAMSRNFNGVAGGGNGVWFAGDGGSILYHPGL